MSGSCALDGGGGHIIPVSGGLNKHGDKLVVSGCSSCSFSWRSHPEQRVAFGSYREQLHGCVQYATCRQAVVRVDNGQQQQWLGIPGAEHYHLWQWQVAVWAAEMA